jgi:hypothetical protein
MGYVKLAALWLSAIAGTAALSWPAAAQCRLCSKPDTALTGMAAEDGISLQIESSLDFDRLVLMGASGGAAVIRPDGSSAAQGSLAGVSARAMVGSASVHGEPGRAVRVELPGRIELFSLGGGRITVDEVGSDLPALPRLDSAGNLSFRFGGRISISGDSDGQYRGDLPITVEYQ